MADDFEIIPEKEISNLKKEIQKVKENPFGDNESSTRFLKTVDNLNDSMNNMLNLFKIAADSMQNEEKEEVFLADKIKPLSEKVDRLLEQNEKIAKALVAIADMVDEIKSQKRSNPLDDLRNSPQVPPVMPQAVPPYQSFGARPPQMSQPQMPSQMSPSPFSSNQDFGAKPSFGQPNMGMDMNPKPSSNQFSQAPPQANAPSPFLDDDSMITQPSQGLPSFSDFSDKKMNMPPPPKDNFGSFGSSQPFGQPLSAGNPFGNPGMNSGAPAKKGLFGAKK